MPSNYKPKRLKLSKPKHIFLILEQVVEDVRNERMKPQQANAIVYAIQTALKAHETLELEKKVKQLEELLDGLKEKN
ncbi:hypothetical protein [Desulfurobacterium crinifex]